LLNKITVYNADLQNTHEVSKVVSYFKPDVIFHLATYYALEHQPQEITSMIDANVLGTLNLLEASKESMIDLFVNTSSCFVYKESKNKLKEDDELKPLNLYALTKIYAEQACSLFTEKYDLKTVTFRLFPPYGPADNERRLIPYVLKNLFENKSIKLTTGKQKWDFTYVDDIVNAYYKLLSLPKFPQKHEIFNIGTGKAVSVREVVSKIKDILGTDMDLEWGSIPHRKNEIWFNSADTKKTKEILNWHPKVTIDKGLELTVKWYKDFFKKKVV
jgi:nucleoside-diphosphate-sugar epimerase